MNNKKRSRPSDHNCEHSRRKSKPRGLSKASQKLAAEKPTNKESLSVDTVSEVDDKISSGDYIMRNNLFQAVSAYERSSTVITYLNAIKHKAALIAESQETIFDADNRLSNVDRKVSVLKDFLKSEVNYVCQSFGK